ncbi:butyrate kinase [Salinispira pacifica]|uniref:Probable butyrate kinase n=1 Tax=Salinispira pacifica TaxID=1307761 RepID=V5WF86_9SPIO|nr:butyrate kinase [Salinispira pacifica]AHC13841.1 Butyrate kinase [Salinispira pacifica]
MSSAPSVEPDTRQIILVINPGSTSTKLALYEMEGVNLRELEEQSISHQPGEIQSFTAVADQADFRTRAAEEFLSASWKHQGLENDGALQAVIGRGGLLAPLAGGVYRVSSYMLGDLSSGVYGEHASNLGGIIARKIADSAPGRYSPGDGGPVEAYIADPVVVDELMDEARPSGLPGMDRRSIFHALNQKACARKIAGRLKRRYEDCNFIVAHMGGGISVGAHRQGRVVDVNNALDGDGPFSPERCGGLPAGQLMEEVIRSYAETGGVPAIHDPVHRELKKRLVGRGGLVAYLGHSDLRKIQEENSSSGKAGNREYSSELIINSMIHQIAKEVAQHGATLQGDVDGIILTGGLAHSSRIIRGLEAKLSWLGKIFVIPGEGEMEALAENARAALRGDRELKEYDPDQPRQDQKHRQEDR